MLKSKERGGGGKPEANPNKVKTRQEKVKCNVNLKKGEKTHKTRSSPSLKMAPKNIL